MLETAKPKLQTDIENAIFEAFKEAEMTQCSNDGSILGNAMEAHIQQGASKYAKKAAEIAAPKIAEAIYDFVKEIGITATPTTLVSPSGPVTGVIKMPDFTIS